MFEIIPPGDDGIRIATNGERRVTVLPDGQNRLFKRRAFRLHSDGFEEQDDWLVAEMDGVYVYFSGDDVVVTRRALYP